MTIVTRTKNNSDLRTVILLAAVLATILFGWAGGAGAADGSLFDKYKLSTEEIIPPKRPVEVIKNLKNAVRENTPDGPAVRVTYNDGTSTLITAEGNDNPFLALQLYDHTMSMPLTKYVLGTTRMDYALAIEAAQNASVIREMLQQAKLSAPGSASVGPAGYVPSNLTAVSELNAATFEMLMKDAPRVQEMIDSAQEAFQWVMTGLPFMILIATFFLQGMNFILGKAMHSKQASGISPAYLVLKMFVWIILLLSFKPLIIELVDFSNLLSINIASIEQQRALNSMISVKVLLGGVFGDTGSLESLVVTICGWLVITSITIMMIGRDVFMAINLLLGPTCLAFGYYKSFTNDASALSEYLSGWFGNFVKLLLWGTITSIMLVALGAFAVIMPMGGMGVVYSTLMALCFVLCAKSIPSYADRLSMLVIAGLLIAVPGAMTSYAATSGKTTVVGGTKFGGRVVGKSALAGLGLAWEATRRMRNRYKVRKD